MSDIRTLSPGATPPEAIPLSVEEDQRQRIQTAHPRERFFYTAYGFTLISHISLPELVTIAPCDSADLEIVIGNVDVTLQEGEPVNKWLQIGKHHCQVWVEGIARYRIEDGRRVIVDRRVSSSENNAADPNDIRVYLLGTVFGVLAHQRGWLPLHVSAINAPNGVWAFTGNSGAGKSTLSAWLHYHYGCDLLTDDVAVVKPEELLPLLHPGPRKIKLWKQTLAVLDLDIEGAQRDLMRLDKYHLSLEGEKARQSEPLKALVVLERGHAGEPASLDEIKGPEAVYLLLEALYRSEIGRSYNPPETIIRNCMALAEQIRIYRYRRPWALQQVSHSLEPLLERMGL